MTTKKDSRGNLRLPLALHKELSHYAIDVDLTLHEVVERAWQALKASNPVPTLQVQDRKPVSPTEQPLTQQLHGHSLDSVTPEVLKWVQVLVRVLESGHEVAIRAITENLIAFEMLAVPDGTGSPAAGEVRASIHSTSQAALGRAADAVAGAKRALEFAGSGSGKRKPNSQRAG